MGHVERASVKDKNKSNLACAGLDQLKVGKPEMISQLRMCIMYMYVLRHLLVGPISVNTSRHLVVERLLTPTCTYTNRR